MKVKTPIEFHFDVEKFVNAVGYFVTNITDVDKLKAAKLLYFLDKYHLIHYAMPIIGDTYYSLGLGPVPSISLNIMSDAIAPSSFTGPLPNKEMFEKYLGVDWETRKYPTFVLKRNPDLDVFSQSEIEALEYTTKKYGPLSGTELIKLTHQELTWKAVEKGEIDYRLFVLDSPNSSRLLELMELDNENREIEDDLNS